MAVVIATGIAADGAREVLGLDVGDSEDEVFWRAFLADLEKRGLTCVQLVISDQHAGLVAALKRSFQGAGHQRCRVHFARNLLALVPKTHTDMVAAVFRTVFAQPGAKTVAATWDEVRDQLTGRFPKIGPLMDEAKTEVLAFTSFPRAHWAKVWSTNGLERVNKEIKRRARVVGIFPNDAAVIRLVGAVLADMHDEWQSGDRRYLSEGSMAQLKPNGDTGTIAPINSGEQAPRINPQSPPTSGALPRLVMNGRTTLCVRCVQCVRRRATVASPARSPANPSALSPAAVAVTAARTRRPPHDRRPRDPAACTTSVDRADRRPRPTHRPGPRTRLQHRARQLVRRRGRHHPPRSSASVPTLPPARAVPHVRRHRRRTPRRLGRR